MKTFVRVAAWIVACGAFGASGVLVYQSQGKLADSRAKLSEANRELANIKEAQQAIENMQSRRQFASTPKEDAEEDRFLNGLRKHAELAGATIVKYEAESKRYTLDGKSPAVLAGLTRHTSSITLEGTYSGLRTFLQSISSSPRLYTFSDVRWSRHDDDCRLSMNLARYVSPPATIKGDSL